MLKGNHKIKAIKGIGRKYAEILQLCGVTGIVALAKQDPFILAQKIAEKNKILKRAYKPYLKQTASASRISFWIEEARKIQRRLI